MVHLLTPSLSLVFFLFFIFFTSRYIYLRLSIAIMSDSFLDIVVTHLSRFSPFTKVTFRTEFFFFFAVGKKYCFLMYYIRLQRILHVIYLRLQHVTSLILNSISLTLTLLILPVTCGASFATAWNSRRSYYTGYNFTI